MSFKRSGSRARDVFAGIRTENPEIVETERNLGSRLTIAKNVLRLRVQRGLTQRQLAELLGVRQPRIAEIESARANLQVDTLDRLATVFAVEPSAFYRVERPRVRTAVSIKPQPSVGRVETRGWERPKRAFATATFGDMENR